MPYVAYNGLIPSQTVGAIVLEDLTPDMLVEVINNGPDLTITTLGTLWGSGGSGGIFIGPTPPTNPFYLLWWDSVGGQLYTRYNDGNTTQWVAASNNGGGDVSGSLVTADGSTNPRELSTWFADVTNVLAFTGADPMGVAPSTLAFQLALATGRNVWARAGRYLLRDQIVLSNGQELFGDGRGKTTLLVDDTFSHTATGVISLTGREQLAPCVRDLSIQFAQPSDQGIRANFKTLAAGGTSGTGGTGVKYPPAIILTTANRFRIYRLRISLAWDGIANAAGNTIGGFFIRDIEMSAFNVGFSLDNSFDFGHISGVHFWPFDLSSSLQTVYRDGLTFAARFGDAGEVDGVNITDFNTFEARVSIAGQSWLQFSNLMMDGNNSTLEVSNGQWVQISNVYFTGSSTGGNTNTGQLNVSGGIVTVTNVRGTSVGACVNITGGSLQLIGGTLVAVDPAHSAVTQSGGLLIMTAVALAANTGAGAWTVPLVHCIGGVIDFQGNTIASGSVGDVGGLVIDIDSNQNSVSGNFWNGWGWSVPGSLGSYGFNGGTTLSPISVQSNATFGSLTGHGVNVSLQSAAGFQRAIPFYTADKLRWAAIVIGAESGSNTGGDFLLARYNDAGVFLDNSISIARATGLVSMLSLSSVTFGLNAPPVVRQTVSGSWGGITAGKNLCTALATFGLITDNTTL